MENATEALKMAGAMLLFAIAVSVAIMALSKARDASDSIINYSERSRTFYEIEGQPSEREVQVDAVITKLYNAYSSQDTVVFYKRVGDSITPVTLYYTEAQDRNTKNGSTVLKDSTLVVNPNSTGGDERAIFGIDLSDEQLRDEPWQSSDRQKPFIDALVNRENSPKYSHSRNIINTSNNISYTTYQDNDNNKPITDRGYQIGFVYNFDGHNTPLINLEGKFIERIGLYNTDSISTSTGEETTDGTEIATFNGTTTSSSIVSFNETDETIENESGTRRKVIQYIYIGE